jgi:type IV fimbrial biogenesis protein FimT
MVSISITSRLAALASPNFNDFIVKMRVDNEISQLHRLLLITRNFAINSGQNAIICPLDKSYQCTEQWQNSLSVFVDLNNNKKFDADEVIISIREEIHAGDKLIYGKGRNKITFKPTGQLSGLANGTFRYCPNNHINKARGIVIARSGRMYQSNDFNNDGIDENRGGKEINCD